ncbi:MAG: sulfatase-like hydrolase/transferase [Pigmentiphaga sp.]|nr:sulfatase-like hydrolase/transferase [Pigmentiphaga sp.]
MTTKYRKRPRNLLFLLSDEHRGDLLGCEGSVPVATPHLDLLAEQGTRFRHAYTPSPICVPARAALATGRWVHQTGYWDNAIAYEGRWTSWHHRLAAAGVRVESIGKLHFRQIADPTGFQQQHEALHIHDGVGLVWGSVRDPLPLHRGPSPIFQDMGPGESSYNRFDHRVTERSIDWLAQRAKEQGGDEERPWCLFVGLVAPHMPFVVPQSWLDRYPPETIALPALHPERGYRRHPWVERMARHWDHDAAAATDERRRLAMACYYGLLSYMDHNVGRILGALDQLGLADDTTVVYSSDHGDNLGSRGLWNKSTLYRESTHIPMIVRGADIPRGAVVDTHVNLVDVYPTALDACGIQPLLEEAALPGASLFELANSEDDAGRYAFSEYHAVGSDGAAYMLAADGYKYHHYANHDPELFDLRQDPQEARNLAGDERYRPVISRFERELCGRLDPAAVDRRAKRDQNDLVARFGGREAALATGNPGATPIPDPTSATG